ncbi:hypothetical protein [Hyphomicrobium sp. D-2]|nr:hypothetical protein [Hyphomicrobium sp. D-2]MDH4981688.1 hypothetical protein [Hyphomicrobium sp. D-2]
MTLAVLMVFKLAAFNEGRPSQAKLPQEPVSLFLAIHGSVGSFFVFG